jgi:hypothetical protein
VDLTGAGHEPGLTGRGPALCCAVTPPYPFGDYRCLKGTPYKWCPVRVDIVAHKWHNLSTMKVVVVPPCPRMARELTAHGFDVAEVAVAGLRPGTFEAVVVCGEVIPRQAVRRVMSRVKATLPNTPWVFAAAPLTATLAEETSLSGAFLTTRPLVPATLASLDRIRRIASKTPRSAEPSGVPTDTLVPEFHSKEQKGRLDAGRIAETLGLALSVLAKSVGVTHSALVRRPTARAAQKGLREIEFAWAVLLNELGSADHARAWLHAARPDLGGKPPLALLTEGSATALADYLRSALAGQPG